MQPATLGGLPLGKAKKQQQKPHGLTYLFLRVSLCLTRTDLAKLAKKVAKFLLSRNGLGVGRNGDCHIRVVIDNFGSIAAYGAVNLSNAFGSTVHIKG